MLGWNLSLCQLPVFAMQAVYWTVHIALPCFHNLLPLFQAFVHVYQSIIHISEHNSFDSNIMKLRQLHRRELCIRGRSRWYLNANYERATPITNSAATLNKVLRTAWLPYGNLLSYYNTWQPRHLLTLTCWRRWDKITPGHSCCCHFVTAIS